MNRKIIWKELVHPEIMEGRYMISEYGDIYSKSTRKILRPFKDRDGYYRIELTVEPKKYKKFYIHRLVALLFVPGRTLEKNQVNHKDSIRDHNHYKNLEWVTISENAIHGYKYGFRENNNQKYTDKLVEIICLKIKEGFTNKEILTFIIGSDDINKNKNIYTLISKIRHKDCWRNVSDKYF